MTIQNIKKRFFTIEIQPLWDKIVEKMYIPLNLHMNQHGVDTESENKNKFDGDDDIEEYNSKHDDAIDEYASPTKF